MFLTLTKKLQQHLKNKLKEEKKVQMESNVRLYSPKGHLLMKVIGQQKGFPFCADCGQSSIDQHLTFYKCIHQDSRDEPFCLCQICALSR